MLDRLFANTGYVLFVAAAWTALFYLNGFFINAAEISPFVSLIFFASDFKACRSAPFWTPRRYWINPRRCADHSYDIGTELRNGVDDCL